MAKKAEAEDDDLLAGKGKTKAGKKTAAKKAPAKKASKSNGKAAAAEDEDEVLAPKAKAGGKKNGKGKETKKTHQRAEDIAATDDVRTALLKCKKFTSYADIQEATGFNIRQIRRTARTMRDNGELELQKEGTIVSVKRA